MERRVTHVKLLLPEKKEIDNDFFTVQNQREYKSGIDKSCENTKKNLKDYRKEKRTPFTTIIIVCTLTYTRSS